MSTQIQFRRGSTADHAAFTGASGEVTVDITKKTAVVHDGSTAGGIPLAKESALNITDAKADSAVATAESTEALMVHNTGAESIAGVKTFTDAVVATGVLGSSGVGRADAQMELRNSAAGHCLLSLTQMKNPGDTTEEAGVTCQAYDSTGVIRQTGSVSYTWANNATLANGFACLRFEVNTVAGSGESPMRIWGGGKGVGLFTTADSQYGNGKYLSINNRDAGKPSIVGGVGGSGDIVIDANDGGTAQSVNLNAYNAGDVYLGIGGGKTVIRTTTGSSSANCAMRVSSDAGTSRSINAAGTINASGADYAEYMRKASSCGIVAKGQIVGINAAGEVTDKWAEAIHFMVKSTDPSYVGGDNWTLSLGDEPKPPKCQIPEYTGSVEPRQPLPGEFSSEPEYRAALEVYAQLAVAYRADQENYAAIVAASQQHYEADTYPQYLATKVAFEQLVERERAAVDRIAFAGQVPVNVFGAQPGTYIVPIQNGDAISGIAVQSPTFEQYQIAVGKVIAIEADGRAKIIVKAI